MELKVKSYQHYKKETKYQLTFVFTIIAMMVSVIYSISFLAIGAAQAAYIQLIGAFIFMSLIGVLRRRIIKYVRHIAILTFITLILIQGMFIFGPSYGLQYQLFPILVVIFLLLDFNVVIERIALYAYAFMAIVVFYVCQWSTFTPFYDGYFHYEVYYYNISIFFSFVGMVFLLYYLSKEIFAVRDQLYNMATTDVLTGLYNRRTFLKRGEESFKIAERGGNCFSVIMYDIDAFKYVNDKYGHLVGDMVLKEIAKVSKETLRETDILARYGGEEFAVILQNTNAEQGLLVAEKIRKAIESRVIEVSPYSITRTVSLGVVGYHFSISSFDDLIDKADKAMYKSKLSGKNKSTAFDMKDPFYRQNRKVHEI